MSLIELLITMAILMLMAGALYGLMLSAKTTWQASATRSGVRQGLQTAIFKIATELKDSRAAFITDATAGAPSAFCFLSAQDGAGRFVTDSAGMPSWQKCVIYYIPAGTTRLLRREVPGSFIDPLPSGQMIGYCDGSGTQCSSSITHMRLVPATSDNSATLSLSAREVNPHGKEDIQSLTVTIFLRN